MENGKTFTLWLLLLILAIIVAIADGAGVQTVSWFQRL